MARTKAAFAGGMRPSDHPGVSVVARVHRRDTVNATLRSPDQDSLRRRDLPADVMVCCVIVTARLRPLATREVLRRPEGGVRWIPPELPVRARRRSRPFVTGARHRRSGPIPLAPGGP